MTIKCDVEAVRWAVSLLELHPGVSANENSQYWLLRLRTMLPPSPPLTVRETQALFGAAAPIQVANVYQALWLYLSRKDKK